MYKEYRSENENCDIFRYILCREGLPYLNSPAESILNIYSNGRCVPSNKLILMEFVDSFKYRLEKTCTTFKSDTFSI